MVDGPKSRPLLRPPLKWAGGKRWLVPTLRELWGHAGADRLVEPFSGGLSVALGLAPRDALLNDVNPHTINFFRQLQCGLQVRIPMANDRDLYEAHRDSFNDSILRGRYRTKKAASLFYYLNRTGYNGLCRFNRSGLYNVPFGRYTRINYVRDFLEYRAALADWQFTNVDFVEVTRQPGDFIYADPPYDVQFRQYSDKGFGWDDQVRLAEWLADHQGPVVVSNQATDRVLALYEKLGFNLRTLKAPRMISSSGDRKPALEMLATKGLSPPKDVPHRRTFQ